MVVISGRYLLTQWGSWSFQLALAFRRALSLYTQPHLPQPLPTVDTHSLPNPFSDLSASVTVPPVSSLLPSFLDVAWTQPSLSSLSFALSTLLGLFLLWVSLLFLAVSNLSVTLPVPLDFFHRRTVCLRLPSRFRHSLFLSLTALAAASRCWTRVCATVRQSLFLPLWSKRSLSPASQQHASNLGGSGGEADRDSLTTTVRHRACVHVADGGAAGSACGERPPARGTFSSAGAYRSAPNHLHACVYNPKRQFLLRGRAHRLWQCADLTEWHLEEAGGKLVAINRSFLVVQRHLDVLVFDCPTNQLRFTIPCERVPACVLATEQWLVISYLGAQGPRVWDLTSLSSVFYGRRVLKTDDFIVHMHALDRHTVACASMSGRITVWDLPSGRHLDSFSHPAAVSSIAFYSDSHFYLPPTSPPAGAVSTSGPLPSSLTVNAPNGPPSAENGRFHSLLVTGHRSTHRGAGEIVVWDCAARVCHVIIPSAHVGPPTQLRLVEDHSGSHHAAAAWPLLLSASDQESCLRLWDLGSGQCLSTIDLHSAPITTLATCGRKVVGCFSLTFDVAPNSFLSIDPSFFLSFFFPSFFLGFCLL